MNDTLKQLLPTIATCLGGPLAGIAAKFVTDKLGLPADTVTNVTSIIAGLPPEKLAELQNHELELKVHLAEIGYANIQAIEELNAKVVTEVNTTMRAEAAAEHWPTYSWRPFIGFTFGAYIVSLWLLPLFHVTPVTMSPDMTLAVGGILGVASWFRGKAQASQSDGTNISMKG